MLRRVWLSVAFIISLFAINQYASAANVNTTTYDIYIGNADDAGGNDYYFAQKPLFILLHGDIATPLFLKGNANFIISSNTSGVYSAAQNFSLTDAQLATKISTGQLKLAQLNTDVFIWNNGIVDQTNILLRGATASDAALLLSNTISSLIWPSITRTYSPSTYVGISDRNTILNIIDVNGDGKKDIVLGSYISTNAQIAYLADATGVPVKFFEMTPSISRPTQSGLFVGGTPGQFRVDESGAATYNIPIAIPEGIAGVKPQLALTYSSQVGDGILGKGWNLSGLSSITRCRQTISQDKKNKAITWTSEDRFCLDGQRLMVVSGAYGAVDSTYKTEIDSDVLVTAKGGSLGHPAYFTVEAKDGSKSTYGNTADSKLAGSLSAVSTTTLTWAINKFEDNAQNRIEYIYTGDASSQKRIATIDYAFSANVSYAKITFEYTARPNAKTGYVAGYAFTNGVQRLNKINVYSYDKDTHAASTVRNYNFGFSETLQSGTAVDLNRLQYVQECVGTACLPATAFTWGDLQEGFQTGSTSSAASDTIGDFKWANISGNGNSDLVVLNKAFSSDGQTYSASIRVKYAKSDSLVSSIFIGNFAASAKVKMEVLDYNADGRSDLAVFNPTTAKWNIYLSIPTVPVAPETVGSWKLSNSGLSGIDLSSSNRVFVDINGDGLSDTIADNEFKLLVRDTAKPVSSNNAYVFSSVTKTFSISDPADPADPAATSGSNSSCVETNRSLSVLNNAFGDFNGDGIIDFVVKRRIAYLCPYTYPGSTSTYYSNNYYDTYYPYISSDINSTTYTLTRFGSSKVSSVEPVIVDVNGDGLSDIVYKGPTYYGNSIYRNKYYYSLNTGNDFNAAVEIIDVPETTKTPQFLDYNHDGGLDVVWIDTTAKVLNIKYWQGSVYGITSVLRSINSSDFNADDLHIVANINNDEGFDYVRVSNTGITTQYATQTHTYGHNVFEPAYYIDSSGVKGTWRWVADYTVPVINSILSIKSGVGSETQINYGSLGASGHYSTADLFITSTTTTIPGGGSACETGAPIYVVEACKAPRTVTSANADAFYTRLNGGWVQLPTDGSVDTLVSNNQDKGSPVLEVNGAMNVVTSVTSKAPAAGTQPYTVNSNAVSKVSYYYTEAHMQAGGRGFLGFQTLKTVDEQTGVVTVNTYRQDFPYVGMPLSTVVFSNDTTTAKLLSRSTNNWKKGSFISETDKIGYRPYLERVDEFSYSLNSGNLLQTVSTVNAMDTEGYGNLVDSTVTTTGLNPVTNTDQTLVKTTHNEYGVDSSDSWGKRLGRLRSSTVTTTLGADSVTRKSRFDYYAADVTNGKRGMLWKEIIESDGIDVLTTENIYDSYGNKKIVNVTGLNAQNISETRSATTKYDNIGRYVTSTVNDLNQEPQINNRNEFGLPTAATDINGIGSNVYYDAIGQEYMRTDNTGAWTRTESAFCGDGVTCPAGAKYRIYKRVAGGGSSIEYFDILGRTIRSTKIGFDGQAINVDTEYDNLSRVKRQSTPFIGSTATSWTVNEYDILGRLTKVTTPDGSISTSAYNDYATTITNPLNQTRTETRNGLGQLVRVSDFLGGRIDYAYDLTGGLLTATTTSAENQSVAVRMCYDKLGRKIAMFDPDKGGFSGDGSLSCSTILASAAQGQTKKAGWWYYSYDAFGELISQRDPKGQVVNMYYDKLGRMIGRVDLVASGAVEGFSQWFYEKGVDGSSAPIQGKLTAVVMNTDPALTTTQINTTLAAANPLASCSQTSVSCHKTLYNFDVFARPLDTTVYYPGSSQGYIARISYDIFGRPSRQYDAVDRIFSNGSLMDSGVQTSFNDYGYANKITDIGSGEMIQQTLTTNERGQVLTELRGNGVTTTNTYDNLTGLLTDQQSGIGSLFSVQNIHYKWDAVGNLKYRDNQTPFKSGGGGTKNLKESFCYDGLNRLIKTVTGVASTSPTCTGTQDITYNGLGNITSKVNVGSYTYGTNAGPHAVTSTANGSSYFYDNNGNLNNQAGNGARTIAYTTYDQPTVITKNGVSTTFSYGPDRARWKRVDVKAGITTTTTYLGNVERITTSNSTDIEWKRYVGGAIYTYKTNASNQLLGSDKSFVYNDHLGSLDVVTNAAGVIQQSLSFDPWGARRSGETWTGFAASELTMTNAIFKQPITTRGFTGHEMVDDMGLIHMNGRIYDPVIARFLQADPLIQAASNTQSYNRYSYVLNNPLNMTDPSGFLWNPLSGLGRSLIKGAVKIFGANVVNIVGSFVSTVVGGPFGAAAWSYEFAKAMGASNSAAFTSAIFAYIGASVGMDKGIKFLDKALIMGTMGGMQSVIQGGNFGNGFVSAGLASIAGGLTGDTYSPTGFIVSTIVGGTISEITGGKFKNGAQSAAMNYVLQWGASKYSAGGVNEDLQNDDSSGGGAIPESGFAHDANGNIIYSDETAGSFCEAGVACESNRAGQAFHFERSSGKYHAGIDVQPRVDGVVQLNASVLSVTEGVVGDIGASGFGEDSVLVITPKGNQAIYGHLRSTTLQVGDTVKVGDVIGVFGNKGTVSPKPTGPSDFRTGLHLHFEIRQGKAQYKGLRLGYQP